LIEGLTSKTFAVVDADGRLEAALDKYLSPITGPRMIAAANAIQWASWIALANPQLADRIARAIVGVRTASYKTAECRNVAIEHAVPFAGPILSLSFRRN